jgi:hypothetical protein
VNAVPDPDLQRDPQLVDRVWRRQPDRLDSAARLDSIRTHPRHVPKNVRPEENRLRFSGSSVRSSSRFVYLKSERGARKLMGDNLKVIWSEFTIII